MHVINLDDKNSSKVTYWVSLFIDRNVAAYFDFFGIEYITQEYIPQQNPNQLLTIYLEYKIMNLLRVDFTVSLSWNILLQDKLC